MYATRLPASLTSPGELESFAETQWTSQSVFFKESDLAFVFQKD